MRHTAAAPSRPTLVAATDGSWFESGGARIDLRRRRAPSRIFALLLSHHADNPHSVVAVDELIAAGWPKQKLVRQAGIHRLYVAVSTLRKLGLGELLQREEDGYRLDPALELRLDASDSP